MPVLPLHLGTFHTYEWVLMMLLIAGPFLLLVGTVVHVRRRDAREEAEEAADRAEADTREPGGRAPTVDATW